MSLLKAIIAIGSDIKRDFLRCQHVYEFWKILFCIQGNIIFCYLVLFGATMGVFMRNRIVKIKYNYGGCFDHVLDIFNCVLLVLRFYIVGIKVLGRMLLHGRIPYNQLLGY